MSILTYSFFAHSKNLFRTEKNIFSPTALTNSKRPYIRKNYSMPNFYFTENTVLPPNSYIS